MNVLLLFFSVDVCVLRNFDMFMSSISSIFVNQMKTKERKSEKLRKK